MSAGCENCRKTERNLAKAIGIIDSMLATERSLLVARQTVEAHMTSLERQRRNAAKWLEELT